MASIPVEFVQNNTDTEARADCLGNLLVLRKILEHLPSADLLKRISFVNKQWNYEARRVLKDRSCLTAHLNSGHPCKDLQTFVPQLQEMNIVPFSGLDIVLDAWAHKEKCDPSCTGDLDPTYKSTLDRLPWKRLSVKLHGHWVLQKSCPGFLLIKSVLQEHCGTLEEFSLHLESKRGQFIAGVLGSNNKNFPRLKVLKIHGLQDTMDETHTNFLKELVSRAPNLEELYHEKCVDFMENVVEGSSAVLVTNYEFNPIYHQFSESILGSLRLKRMRLDHISNEFSVGRFNRVISMLLETSRSTLKSLYLDAVFLVPLMCYGIRLENVTKLEIYLDCHYLESARPDIFRLLKAFDFTRIFPRLTRVDIDACPGSMEEETIGEFVDQANDLWKEPMADRAVNIKLLVAPVKSSNVQLFSAMFPDIESLLVRSNRATDVPYPFIWKGWEDTLKELEVQKSGLSMLLPGKPSEGTWNENLDSVFCGIFPEEVAWLREMEDEFLEKVNIVPVMPAITTMKALRTFKLLNIERGFFAGKTDRTFIFSKVTGIIAFKRCPKLIATLSTNSYELERALNHMKPYAELEA